MKIELADQEPSVRKNLKQKDKKYSGGEAGHRKGKKRKKGGRSGKKILKGGNTLRQRGGKTFSGGDVRKNLPERREERLRRGK